MIITRRLQEKEVKMKMLLLWIAYRLAATAAAYSFGWIAGYLLSVVTQDIEIAIRWGTMIGLIGGLAVDWTIFKRIVRRQAASECDVESRTHCE